MLDATRKSLESGDIVATIRDVAREAGVSVATVSRVLNGNYPVSQEKRSAVNKAVKKLKFTPNILGRNLGRTENRTIVVAVSAGMKQDATLLTRSLQGLSDVIAEEGYDMLISYLPAAAPNQPRESSVKRLEQLLQGGFAGGLMILGPILKDPTFFDRIGAIPVVRCGEGVLPLSGNCVAYDNEQAGYDLAKTMIQRGYKRFSFFLSQKTDETLPSDFALARKKGMEAALAEAGLAYDERLTLVVQTDNDDAQFAQAAKASGFYLSLPPEERPDAIICSYDALALACMNTLQRGGIVCPDQIAIAGFDDTLAASYCDPQLTSVRQPSQEMSREAARILLSIMRGEQQNGIRMILPCTVVERGSTTNVETTII